MLTAILVILILLFITGNLNLSGLSFLDVVLFSINGQAITLLNLLVFGVILSALGVLPSPLREIGGVLFVLWILSILGFLAIAGLSNLLILAIIIGIVFSIFNH